MSTDQLAGDAVHHLVESEAILFASQLAVIDHLEQQVAQFLAQLREIPLLYGVRYFVGFFQGVRDDGRVALLEIPGAAEFGIAQARHEVEQVVESVHGYLGSSVNGPGILPFPETKGHGQPASARGLFPPRLKAYGCAAPR